jgi:hypothetical protein
LGATQFHDLINTIFRSSGCPLALWTLRGGRRPVIQVAVPGRTVGGYRSGANLVPDNPVGTIGFAEYLTETE